VKRRWLRTTASQGLVWLAAVLVPWGAIPPRGCGCGSQQAVAFRPLAAVPSGAGACCRRAQSSCCGSKSTRACCCGKRAKSKPACTCGQVCRCSSVPSGTPPIVPPSESQEGKCLVGLALSAGCDAGTLLPAIQAVSCPRGDPGVPATAQQRLSALCRFVI
jgi:hypothetical protein